MFGNKNGSLSNLSRGRRKVSTSFGLAKRLRISTRAIHAESQISLHEIGAPFSSSAGAMIHRLSTGQSISLALPDKTFRSSRGRRRRGQSRNSLRRGGALDRFLSTSKAETDSLSVV